LKKRFSDGIKKIRDTQGQTKTVVLQPTVLVLATYILMLLSKLIDFAFINRENEYFSIVMLQMMIFLLPGALWCKFSGERYTQKLRIKLPAFNTVPLMLSAALALISGGVLISVLFGGLDSLSHNFSLYDTFISKDNGTVGSRLYLLLAFAVLPAICEEFGGVFAMCLILVCMSMFLLIVNISMELRKNTFYKLVAIGLGAEYAFQVFLTIGGVTKFIPMTGITLPLVSYGGSSVMSTIILIAIIQGLYILREDEGVEIEKKKIRR
jgi:hypothetical protein